MASPTTTRQTNAVGASLRGSGRGQNIDSVPPRKQPVSVRIDGTHWRISCSAPPSPATAESAVRAIWRIVLPQPSVYEQRQGLAADVVADFAAILCSFGITAAIQIAATKIGFSSSCPRFGGIFGLRAALLYGVLFTLFGYSEHLYDSATIQAARTEYEIAGKCSVWSTGLAAGVLGIRALNLVPLAVLAIVSSFLLIARRVVRRHFVRGQTGREVKNVLIVGAGSLAQRVAENLECSPMHKRIVLGFLDDHAPIGGKVRGRIKDLSLLAETDFVDEIILAGVEHQVARRAIWEAERAGIDVAAVPELFGLNPDPLPLERVGDVPLLTLRQTRFPRLDLAVKRLVDILGSGIGLILFLPALALIAATIRLESPGPALYRAARIGFKGRRFLCHKFRTMVTDADKWKDKLRAQNERKGAFFKIQNDPRITRVGRLLRRYSLDELPQLWNVLRGEMSLVGPRPHPVDDFARYRVSDMKRLKAVPGLTGLWQVTARQDPSFDRNVALDREYIEHWSLASDFRILRRTISAVLQGSGS